MEDKPTLTNDQIRERKSVLRREIEQLTSKIGNPDAYTTKEGQPFRISKDYAIAQEELNKKVAEYNTLVESFVVANLRLNKIITFTDGNYTIKYVPEKNRYDFYIGNEYRKGTVAFNEELTEATVTCPTVSSDTKGELVNYIYKVQIAEPKDIIVKRTQPKPCSLVEEGEAMVSKPDSSFMTSMGYVVDESSGQWRMRTPLEYEAQMKAKQAKPETKKGLSGRFSLKRK
jgi:hypothetical protein